VVHLQLRCGASRHRPADVTAAEHGQQQPDREDHPDRACRPGGGREQQERYVAWFYSLQAREMDCRHGVRTDLVSSAFKNKGSS
jgi:hypothetical protein